VIGTLAADEKIASLKPLGDRVLIKVRQEGAAWAALQSHGRCCAMLHTSCAVVRIMASLSSSSIAVMR
jgi:hypothetical protein